MCWKPGTHPENFVSPHQKCLRSCFEFLFRSDRTASGSSFSIYYTFRYNIGRMIRLIKKSTRNLFHEHSVQRLYRAVVNGQEKAHGRAASAGRASQLRWPKLAWPANCAQHCAAWWVQAGVLLENLREKRSPEVHQRVEFPNFLASVSALKEAPLSQGSSRLF